MKEIASNVMRIIEAHDDPTKRVESLTTWPHQARNTYYVRLYDDMEAPDGTKIQGNLKMNVNMLSGDDCPCPEPDGVPLLLDDYRRHLRRNDTKPLWMFVVEGYVYYDEFEDEMDPSKPEYNMLDEPIDGKKWMTIDEVCDLRDIDKSTVTRAIYARELICGQSTDDGRRYISRDENFDFWRPERKKSYLRDRRLLIAYEIVSKYYMYTVEEFYKTIEIIERKRFGGNHLPEEGIESFMADVIENAPTTLIEWQSSVIDLCKQFGLSDEKKWHRGFGEKRAA